MSTKYFGISLPRTGTSSLHYAMYRLGLKGLHYLWDMDYDLIQRLDFANDFPISLRYKELDKKFAGSKFIYSDRPVDEWVKSYETHWQRTGHLTCGKWDVYNKEAFGTLTFDRDTFAERFLKHREEIFKYFKGRDDLLVLEMPYTKAAWGLIIEYVGVPEKKKQQVISLGFPHACGSYASSNGWCPKGQVRVDDKDKYYTG